MAASTTMPDEYLLQSIVTAAGYESTTFLDIFKAYNAVLEQEGIDPAEDTQYYRFILKLGMVPGTNWGSRWERWQSDQAGRPGPSSSPATTPRSSPIHSVRSLPQSSRGTRSEAVWDEHEDQYLESTEQSRDEDGEYEDDSQSARLTNDSSVSASQVGYNSRTQHHEQGKMSVRSLSPPQRTSTPLASRSSISRNRQHRASTTPRPPRTPSPDYTPASSARSYSSASRHPPPSSQYSHNRPSSTPLHLHTPTPRQFSPSIPAFLLPTDELSPPPEPVQLKQHHPRKPAVIQASSVKPQRTAAARATLPATTPRVAKVPKVVSESRAAIEAELQREDEERERRKEDEIRAERFYDLGVVGRCWDVWRTGREWVTTTSLQIDRARARLLLASSLTRWRDRLAKLQALDDIASAHYARALVGRSFDEWAFVAEFERELLRKVGQDEENRVVGKTWLRWRQGWERRRKKRWEASLLVREGEMQAQIDARVKREALRHWRALRLTLVATSHHELTSLRSAFSWWRSLTSHRISLDARERDWQALSDERTTARTFDTWRTVQELREKERITEAKVDRRAMTEAWETWKDGMELKHAGDLLRRENLLRFGLRAIRHRLDKVQNLHHLADQHLAETNRPILRRVLRSWRLQARERTFEALVDERIQTRAFDTWRDRFRKQEHLGNQVQTFKQHSSRRLLARTLASWIDARHQRREALAHADLVHANSLVSSSFRSWVVLRAAKRKEASMADVAHEFLLKRRTWLVWSEQLRRKERDKWVQQKEHEVLSGVFRVWLEQTRRNRALREVEDRFGVASDQRLRVATLTAWATRLARQRTAQANAISTHSRRLLTGAFSKWTDGCVKHGEQISLMQSFRDVKDEDTLRRTFSHWLHASRLSRHRRASHATFLAQQRLTLLSSTLSHWVDRHREARLRPLETQLAALHSRNTLDGALYKWEASSNVAAAIHFDKTRLKRAVLRRWRGELPRVRERNERVRRERREVLSRTLEVWRAKTRKKLALKPAPRLRGITRARPRLSAFSSVDRSRAMSSPSGSTGRD